MKAPARSLLVGAPDGHRVPPVEFADAVTMYYRDHGGRRATLVWIPVLKMWQIRIEPRMDDPRLLAWREGRLKEQPLETIELAEYKENAIRNPRAKSGFIPGYVGFNLEDIGVSGLLALLGEADTTTGTGRFNSLSEAVAFQRQKQKDASAKLDKQVRAQAVDRAVDKRRSTLKIPFLGVGIDLKSPNTATGAD